MNLNVNWEKIMRYGLVVVIVGLFGVVVYGAIGKYSTDKEMAKLRNELALKDSTIEIQTGVYTKLSVEAEDLKKLLDTKDTQIKGLADQIKKNKEEYLAATQLVVMWKKAYEGLAQANQSHVDPAKPGDPGRDKVSFNKDFGMIGVDGYTLTNPAEAWVSVKQLRPLRITLAITQDKDKKWHSYATSSEENTAIDIALASVNPFVLEPKWYEKIQFNATVAGGTTANGFGVLAGIGASYKIKQFDIGPAVFLGINSKVSAYFGASFGWRPFEK